MNPRAKFGGGKINRMAAGGTPEANAAAEARAKAEQARQAQGILFYADESGAYGNRVLTPEISKLDEQRQSLLNARNAAYTKYYDQQKTGPYDQFFLYGTPSADAMSQSKARQSAKLAEYKAAYDSADSAYNSFYNNIANKTIAAYNNYTSKGNAKPYSLEDLKYALNQGRISQQPMDNYGTTAAVVGAAQARRAQLEEKAKSDAAAAARLKKSNDMYNAAVANGTWNPRKYGSYTVFGAEGGAVKKYSGTEGSYVSNSNDTDARLRQALAKARKETPEMFTNKPKEKAKKEINWEENETNVPDWVLEDSVKMKKEFAAEQAKKRAEKAKEKAERKKEQDDWGKEQVDRQERRKQPGQESIPDAPAPLSEGNIEKELKFNPGRLDEMTADEARGKSLEGLKSWAKGGKVAKKSTDKNWISKAIKKPGALRESLGVKKGEKIPAKKLATAAKKPGKTGQRARLAQTLKGFSKGGGIESRGKTRCKIC